MHNLVFEPTKRQKNINNVLIHLLYGKSYVPKGPHTPAQDGTTTQDNAEMAVYASPTSTVQVLYTTIPLQVIKTNNPLYYVYMVSHQNSTNPPLVHTYKKGSISCAPLPPPIT